MGKKTNNSNKPFDSEIKTMTEVTSTKVKPVKTIGTIVELQISLNKLKCFGKDGNTLEVDGNIGTNTMYAIRQFQIKNNLNVDGVPGYYTWSLIRKKLEVKNVYI